MHQKPNEFFLCAEDLLEIGTQIYPGRDLLGQRMITESFLGMPKEFRPGTSRAFLIRSTAALFQF